MNRKRTSDTEPSAGALRSAAELVPLIAALSKNPEIAMAVLDNRLRFQYVNPALVAMHTGVPAGAFVGSTLHDILGNAAPETEARFERVAALGETPVLEVSLKLPGRNELGYWIEKGFARTASVSNYSLATPKVPCPPAPQSLRIVQDANLTRRPSGS